MCPLRRALDQIRPMVEPQTWNAFWNTAVLGRWAPDVAEGLGLNPAAVRQAKSRILRRLRRQLGDRRVRTGLGRFFGIQTVMFLLGQTLDGSSFSRTSNVTLASDHEVASFPIPRQTLHQIDRLYECG